MDQYCIKNVVIDYLEKLANYLKGSNSKQTYLSGKRCYLSAPIQHAANHNWRPGVIKTLTEEFGLDLFDPFADPKQQWVPLLNAAQKNKDFDEMARIARSFVRKDLCLIDRADLVIAYLPHKVCTTGVHHEIINSVNAKKPTLLISDGKEKVPLWYYGFIPHQVMFSSFDELYAYLRDVNEGKHKDNNRWAYVYGLV